MDGIVLPKDAKPGELTKIAAGKNLTFTMCWYLTAVEMDTFEVTFPDWALYYVKAPKPKPREVEPRDMLDLAGITFNRPDQTFVHCPCTVKDTKQMDAAHKKIDRALAQFFGLAEREQHIHKELSDGHAAGLIFKFECYYFSCSNFSKDPQEVIFDISSVSMELENPEKLEHASKNVKFSDMQKWGENK